MMKRLYIKIRDYIYQKFPELYIHIHLLRMWIQGADKYQRWLEKGDFYLYRGSRAYIGMPVKVKYMGKTKTRWIRNMFYDFGKRKITALYSNKPIIKS